MMMVFGGTTEGRGVASLLDRMSIGYIYSTKSVPAPFPMTHGMGRHGVLDEESMGAFFRAAGISAIIDAAHPFALELHRNVDKAAQACHLPVIRFERNYDLPPDVVQGAKLYYADSFPAAVDTLRRLEPERMLAVTGVQTIEPLRPYWQEHDMRLRILPSGSSVVQATRSGFPPGKLVLMHPPRTMETERHCLLAYGIHCILTKENGTSGFLPEKILAAKTLDIPVVIVRRPELPESWNVVSSSVELKKLLERGGSV
jgi:precorrin-6A/cobalt-precorrin-6A reductase